MADDLDLGDEQDDGKEDQRNPGIIHGEGLHREEGQDQGNAPITPGRMTPGLANSK